MECDFYNPTHYIRDSFSDNGLQTSRRLTERNNGCRERERIGMLPTCLVRVLCFTRRQGGYIFIIAKLFRKVVTALAFQYCDLKRLCIFIHSLFLYYIPVSPERAIPSVNFFCKQIYSKSIGRIEIRQPASIQTISSFGRI